MDPLITPGGTAPVTNLEIELMGALLSGNMPDWFQVFLDTCESSPGQTEETEGALDTQAQNIASTSSDVSAGGNTPSSPFSAIPNSVPLQAMDAQLHDTDSGKVEAPHSTPLDYNLPSNNIPNVGKRRLSDPEVQVQAKRVRHANKDTDLHVQVAQPEKPYEPYVLGSGISYPPQPSQFFFPPPLVLPPRYFPGAPPATPAASSSAHAQFMMPQAMYNPHNPAYYPPPAPLHAGGFSVLTPYGGAQQAAMHLPYPFAPPEQTQQVMGLTAVPGAYSSAPAPVMMPQTMFNAHNPAYYHAHTFGAPLPAASHSVMSQYGHNLQAATPAHPPEQEQQVMGVTAVHAAYASTPAPVMMPQTTFNAPNPADHQLPAIGAPLPSTSSSVGTPCGDALQVATPAPAPFAEPAPLADPEPFAAPEPPAAPEQKQQVTVTQPGSPASRKTRVYAIQPPGRGEVADSPDASRQRTIEAHRANDARARDTDDIICLWTEPGAGAQPCHLVCRGTDALLAHCVAQHGVSRSKYLKEKTRCGWADCALPDITMGGLKRHLAESQLHARRGRIRKPKAVVAEAVKAEDEA